MGNYFAPSQVVPIESMRCVAREPTATFTCGVEHESYSASVKSRFSDFLFCRLAALADARSGRLLATPGIVLGRPSALNPVGSSHLSSPLLRFFVALAAAPHFWLVLPYA